MGFGDEIMGSGLARGAHARGRKIAFGDGHKIVWTEWSDQVYRYNHNVARPGDSGNLEWIAHYRGCRLYNKMSPDGRRWIWNYDFKATPGEMYFTDIEMKIARMQAAPGFVLIESRVPEHKSCAPNKIWPRDRYQQVADLLARQGHRVIQFSSGNRSTILRDVAYVRAGTFRDACAILAGACMYVGPEGGLHHAAAALGVPGVVLFGGFIPPSVTGYEIHKNLTGNSKEACGSLYACKHCADAMRSISVDEVLQAVGERIVYQFQSIR